MSRQNDPTVKQREHAIQSLELAYHKCKEIEANLAEGTSVSYLTRSSLKSKLGRFQFHQGFSVLLKSFKDECQHWARQRSSELEYVYFRGAFLRPLRADTVSRLITRSMASVSLGKPGGETEEGNALPTPVSPRRDLPPPKVPGVGLPPPDSDDWEEVALPPPPPGANRPGTRSTTRGRR